MFDLRQLRAHWLARDLLVWPGAEELLANGCGFSLHASTHGHLRVADGTLAGGYVQLVLAGDASGPPPRRLDGGWRHLHGSPTLRPTEPLPRGLVAELLRGQLAVAATDADGRLAAATGVQIPGVLDDVYADAATRLPPGVTWHGDVPTLRLWAPTAHHVRLHLFDDPQPHDAADPLGDARASVDCARDDASGTWHATGDASWRWAFYLFEVTVYAPATGRVETNVVTDPASRSLSCDSARSQIVDLDDPALQPDGWTHLAKPPPARATSVYELHLRDFSAHDPGVPPAHVGTFKAFAAEGSQGMAHLRSLAAAGLTHVQLLPISDMATVPEDHADQVVPHIETPDDPASEEPQAIQQATRDRDPFNWGYDPLHLAVPEGSYATDANGPVRILEAREMVAALNAAGLRLVVDVVANHTYAAGQHPRSVLDRIVPGYYHRLDERGAVTTSTCCPNVAAEHRMAEHLVVDAVVAWARHYKVDGFRFDLMGHHPKATMQRVRAALDGLTVDADGVDGRQILVYGEGWDFGEVAGGARFTQATQPHMAGTRIATYNDRLRDAIRGGHPFLEPTLQGFATGLGTDPADDDGHSPDAQARAARWVVVQVRAGLAGNLADYPLRTPDSAVTPAGEHGGYTADPADQVAYASAHDNETLFDAIQLKAPAATSIDERVRMQMLALSIVALSQGVALFHAGSDLLRSKSLDRDSYRSGDWFNRLDWHGRRSNFGVGLPPAERNGHRWPLLRKVLRSRPRPTPAHTACTAAHLREMLAIRASSELFAMTTGEEVTRRLRFHCDGPDHPPGLIVMSLTGGSGDAGFTDALVVFNAAPQPAEVADDTIPAGDWRLHPVQQASVDERLGEAAHTDRGVYAVPGRTTAVFVADRS